MGATYAECSSKEMRGVDEVFSMAVDSVISIEEQGYSTQQPGRIGRKDRSSAIPSGGGQRPGKKIKKRTCKIL